ncbi:MAG: hypothetical protein U0Z53_30380 [Blastocatellia bacterium]
MYVVWLPMMVRDDREAAVELSSECADRRITNYWDGPRRAGRAWQQSLELSVVAWDVYLVYGPDARWQGTPPKPDFWMHQLGRKGTHKGAPLLNEAELETKVREQLRKIRTTK